MTHDILALVESRDCWIADRNFCTFALLNGIATRQAFFVIRHHAKLRIVSSGTPRHRGRSETGEVFEQKVTLEGEDGTLLQARRIVLRLDTPTRDGETALGVITNVPPSDASAVMIAALYRKRWTLETMFFELTQMLNGELDTIGYPRAALLGFGIALVSYNLLSVTRAALRTAFGAEKVDEEVSSYYIANEARVMHEGLDIATDPQDWSPFQTMSAARLAEELVKLARAVRLPALRRHRRGAINSRRAFLNAHRAKCFPTFKQGRSVAALWSDVENWMRQRPEHLRTGGDSLSLEEALSAAAAPKRTRRGP